MTKPIPVLELINLKVGFADAPVVHGVSLTIEKGEMLALVGESGCGKSLTAFAIMRLLPPGAHIMGGQAVFDGLNLATVAPRDLRAIRGNGISLILQEPMTSLNPVLTIGAQIAEVLRRHQRISRAAAKRRVLELLELVGITDPHRRYDQFPHNFSGGMRQRIVIAIAIACNPSLLIADEPTTALDVTIQKQVMDLLDTLRRELAMAVLLITHDLGVVGQWADRVAVMYAGRLVETAPTSGLLAAPRHPYSRGLIDASIGSRTGSYKDHRLPEIRGSVLSAMEATGCSFAPRCPEVFALCEKGEPPLLAIEPGRAAACLRAERELAQ